MTNVIRPVQDIQQRAQLGRITEDDRVEHYLKTLLLRIQELEQNILPFVRAFEINRHNATELVPVFYRDLAAAREVMDPMNSVVVDANAAKRQPEPEGLMGEVF